MIRGMLIGVLLVAGIARAGDGPHCDDARWEGCQAMAAPCGWCQGTDPCTTAAASAQASCAAAQADCQAVGEVTVTCPACAQCPNVVPACQRLVRRYDRHGRVRSETCKRWTSVSVRPVP